MIKMVVKYYTILMKHKVEIKIPVNNNWKKTGNCTRVLVIKFIVVVYSIQLLDSV